MQKKGSMKKLWNQRWRPRNGCGDLIMAKFLIATIQVNFGADSHLFLQFGCFCVDFITN